MSDEDPEVDGERCEITKLEQPQKESVQSKWSRPVPRNVYIAKKDLETHGIYEWMHRVSLHTGWWMQTGPQSRVSSKDGGTSERHGQVREDTAEGQRVRRESHDRE